MYASDRERQTSLLYGAVAKKELRSKSQKTHITVIVLGMKKIAAGMKKIAAGQCNNYPPQPKPAFLHSKKEYRKMKEDFKEMMSRRSQLARSID
jgi:chorismate synthase